MLGCRRFCFLEALLWRRWYDSVQSDLMSTAWLPIVVIFSLDLLRCMLNSELYFFPLQYYRHEDSDRNAEIVYNKIIEVCCAAHCYCT